MKNGSNSQKMKYCKKKTEIFLEMIDQKTI